MPGFSTLPPTAQLAELRTISLHQLIDYNEGEVEKLVLACQEVGFFYLDLTTPGSFEMLQNLEDLSAVMANWFSQSREMKTKVETVSRSHGYVLCLLNQLEIHPAHIPKQIQADWTSCWRWKQQRWLGVFKGK